MTPIVVCFGTTKVSGDSFAPTVGSFLKNHFKTKCFVYGDLENPIDAKHVNQAIEHISRVHEKDVIISVDASIGDRVNMWKIRVKQGGVRPAEAVDGKNDAFGDIGVLTVVAEKLGSPLANLMMAPINKVTKMAFRVAFLIDAVLKAEESKRNNHLLSI